MYKRKEIENYDSSEALKIRKDENRKMFSNNIIFIEKISNTLKLKGSERILDAGCGYGDTLQYLYNLKPNCAYVGIDISEGMIKEAKEKTNKNIKYQVADIQKLSFQDESFDIIIAKHMLYHVDNIKKAFDEIYRVLKKGGILIITINSLKNKSRLNIENYKKLIKKLLKAKLVETISRINMENYDKYVDKNKFRLLEENTYYAYADLDNPDYLVNYMSSFRDFFIPKPTAKEWNQVLEKIRDEISKEIKKKGKLIEIRGAGLIKLEKI